MSFLERIFKLSQHKTSVKTEVIAGLSTFLTMAYIALVNPSILSAAHMSHSATFTATCVVTAFACFLVGVLSNYPIAIAPAMALNAYFSYVVVLGMGYAWQTALGAVFISGLLFFIIAITPLRHWLIDVIPKTMNMAISAGLGLFIAMLGLRNGGLIVSDPHTLVSLGNVHAVPTILFFLSFCIIVALDYLRVQGAIVIGIVLATMLGLITGYAHFDGLVSMPPSLMPNFLQLNLDSLFTTHQGLSVIFAFFLISIFDSTGTFVGILHQANLFHATKADNKKLSRGLVAASVASMAGGLLGTSSCSAYSESASGVRAGGRTGLTSVVISVLFLAALFFSPLAKTIPSYATASALLFVGCLMVKSFSELNWSDMTETIPSVITAIMIPLTFSIAVGIGLGFISYVLIKLFTGKIKSVHPMLIVWALIFIGYFMSVTH
ncbi:MAG: guanine permease [Gammaproteobacteria bacterium CG_4_10_14_0_8_um_filter_38_16]|nr:MAG: guanine permease [Gammaproteobacteria bacterium CG_4_10_14_0_8_um_filter_38_16]PJA02926.1 MAG: guanine permease [Gammaproteobacteria bacterium CG_4_10_14_0_2_um_filter_38_22]PJB11407.1 MAG: guanine permease [Gammaproteobacteria bacterium CG_4_9_14_3_um_filter_38_9]